MYGVDQGQHGLFGRRRYTHTLSQYLHRLDVDYSTQFHPSANATRHVPALRDLNLDQLERRFLLVGHLSGELNLFDLESADESYHPVASWTAGTSPSRRPGSQSRIGRLACLAWYPVDSGLFFVASINGTVSFWDSNRFEPVDTVTLNSSASWLAVSPISVGHNLVAISCSRSLPQPPSTGKQSSSTSSSIQSPSTTLIDPLMGSAVLSLASPNSSAAGFSTVHWSPLASNLLITGGFDGSILYWDIRQPTRPLYCLDKYATDDDETQDNEATAHSGPVLALAHSPDSSRRLVSWGGAGGQSLLSLRLWSSNELGDGEIASRLQQPRPTLCPINFGLVSVANKQQASTSNSGDLASRRAALPTRLAVFDDNNAARSNLFACFAPASSKLMTASICRQDTRTQPPSPRVSLTQRHFGQINATVWNSRLGELYTCGSDGNLLCWRPRPSSNDCDEDVTL